MTLFCIHVPPVKVIPQQFIPIPRFEFFHSLCTSAAQVGSMSGLSSAADTLASRQLQKLLHSVTKYGPLT